MNPDLKSLYGHKVRVRVSGFCWRNGELLMINHKGLREGDFWAPPGGGLEFGETAEQRLRTEFLEEAGLEISVGPFRLACEFIAEPLHAIELFFDVDLKGGTVKQGHDPELNIIGEVRFMSFTELTSLPAQHLHGIFAHAHSAEELRRLNGFFRI